MFMNYTDSADFGRGCPLLVEGKAVNPLAGWWLAGQKAGDM
jgi:hypothetical protein